MSRMTPINREEKGLVSFMVTLMMMVVIALIVIGFTQVTANNRRQQLDRELSMQAFYAAESGVNATITAIQQEVTASGGDLDAINTQTDCSATGPGAYAAQYLNSDNTVGYTCVLVNPLVDKIQTAVNRDSSTVFPLSLADSNGNPVALGAATTMTLTWGLMVGSSNSNPANCATTLGQFPSSTDYVSDCGYPILRMDLMNTKNVPTPSISAATLADNTISFYGQPMAGGAAAVSVNSFGAAKAYIVGASCNAGTATCTATINFSGTAKTTDYHMRLSSLYGDTDSVTVQMSGNSGTYFFKGAQAKIDVTGKAQDVLRRVQVNVPLQSFADDLAPEGAIQSVVGVCKQFGISPTYYAESSNCIP